MAGYALDGEHLEKSILGRLVTMRRNTVISMEVAAGDEAMLLTMFGFSVERRIRGGDPHAQERDGKGSLH